MLALMHIACCLSPSAITVVCHTRFYTLQLLIFGKLMNWVEGQAPMYCHDELEVLALHELLHTHHFLIGCASWTSAKGSRSTLFQLFNNPIRTILEFSLGSNNLADLAGLFFEPGFPNLYLLPHTELHCCEKSKQDKSRCILSFGLIKPMDS